MTVTALARYPCKGRTAGHERGVMLVVCMVFLLVISLTAGVTVRRATSSDAVAGNARTQVLALQAAEAALLYCERLAGVPAAEPARQAAQAEEPVTGAPNGPAEAPVVAGQPFLWEVLQNWDGPDSGAKVHAVPFADSNSGGANRYFRRPPECMAQYRSPGNTASAVVTARGFGPDVAQADGQRSPPRGAEVWLQTVVEASGGGKPASRAWRQVFLRTD